MSRTSFLWITDPWDTLDHDRDTTLRLAHEAILQGHASNWADLHSIRFEAGEVLADVYPLSVRPPSPAVKGHQLSRGKPSAQSLKRFKSVNYRVDPPVDLAYLQPLQILHYASIKTVNPIELLLSANEKLEASRVTGAMPPTLISAQWEKLSAFGLQQGKTVLKPLHSAQSRGVELLDWSSARARDSVHETIELATDHFTRPVVLQQYLREVTRGEKRLWFVDGKLLAVIKKLPLKGDFKVDIDRGSQLEATTLNTNEKQTALRLSRHLKQRKIRLAAVDLIDRWVTDFNFTSPGLLCQMEILLKKNLARTVISALARKA